MSDRRVSKKELEAFWRGDKDTYQRMYALRMLQKADEAERQGKQITYVPNDGSGTLEEVVITAPRETEELKQARLKLDYENLADNAITAAGFIPGLDTAADIADIGNSWRKGDYSGMLWGLAGLGLPVSGRVLKSGWNWLKGASVGKFLDFSLSNKNMEGLLKDQLNQRMRQETDYFSPLKVKNKARNATIVGDVINVADNKTKSKNLSDLSMDDIYNLARRDVMMNPIGQSFRLGDTAPKYLVHLDATGLQPISDTGFIPKTEGWLKVKEGEDPEIWYNRFNAYYPTELTVHPRTIVVLQPKLELLGHTFNGTHGRYSNVIHSKEEVPFDAVEFGLEMNPDGKSFNKVKYTTNKKLEMPLKTSLRFYERSPQYSNTIETWTFPFKNNMGLLNHRTSSVTGNKFGNFIAEGSEQMVFDNPDNAAEVLKIYSDIGLSSLNDLRKFVKDYQTRNNVPFLLPTKFVGHVTDKNGLFYPVFSQQKIKETLKNDLNNWDTNIIPRLNAQMKSVGFSGNGYYTRNKMKIGDIQPQNITELPNGQFRFIDAFPEGFKKGGKL